MEVGVRGGYVERCVLYRKGGREEGGGIFLAF